MSLGPDGSRNGPEGILALILPVRNWFGLRSFISRELSADLPMVTPKGVPFMSLSTSFMSVWSPVAWTLVDAATIFFKPCCITLILESMHVMPANWAKLEVDLRLLPDLCF